MNTKLINGSFSRAIARLHHQKVGVVMDYLHWRSLTTTPMHSRYIQ
ncbi:hypothetical protein [Laspinema olomoucense]|nr:hypothetical protein [Laspinema sp. D3a]MCT7991573.1 hypothetical protein [Laspinema sp. D3a]